MRECSRRKFMNTTNIVSKLRFSFAVTICPLLFVPVLFGQSPSSQPSSEGWRVQTTPYLWGTSIDGRIGVGDRTADVDASFGNILDHLHFAFMNLAQATWNKQVVVLTDLVYADLRGYHATPGPLFSGVSPNQKLLLLSPEGGYRILDNTDGSVDAIGGIRYWHLKTELQFQPGVRPGMD